MIKTVGALVMMGTLIVGCGDQGIIIDSIADAESSALSSVKSDTENYDNRSSQEDLSSETVSSNNSSSVESSSSLVESSSSETSLSSESSEEDSSAELSAPISSSLSSSSSIVQDIVWRFAVVADTRADLMGINEGVMVSIMNDILLDSTMEFLLVPGDITQTGADDEEKDFIRIIKKPLDDAGVKVYTVAGNHEYEPQWVDGWERPVGDFSELYPLNPKNGPNSSGKTYSFTHRNALIIAFDWYSDGLEQEWVEEQVQESGATHIFPMSHMPLWRGPHVEEYDYAARETFIDYMTQRGGKMWLCGHDHFYSHTKVYADQQNEFHQFIVGTGGPISIHDPDNPWDGEYGKEGVDEVLRVNPHGYSSVTVIGDSVLVEYKQMEGHAFVTIDSWGYSLEDSPISD